MLKYDKRSLQKLSHTRTHLKRIENPRILFQFSKVRDTNLYNAIEIRKKTLGAKNSTQIRKPNKLKTYPNYNSLIRNK